MIKIWINWIFLGGGDSLTALQSPPFKVTNRRFGRYNLPRGILISISLESSHNWVAWVLFIAQLAHHASENTISSGEKVVPRIAGERNCNVSVSVFPSVMPWTAFQTHHRHFQNGRKYISTRNASWLDRNHIFAAPFAWCFSHKCWKDLVLENLGKNPMGR